MCHILSCIRVVQFSPLFMGAILVKQLFLTSLHFFLLPPHLTPHEFVFIIEICFKKFIKKAFAISHPIYTRLSLLQYSPLCHLSHCNSMLNVWYPWIWILGGYVCFLQPYLPSNSLVPDT